MNLSELIEEFREIQIYESDSFQWSYYDDDFEEYFVPDRELAQGTVIGACMPL